MPRRRRRAVMRARHRRKDRNDAKCATRRPISIWSCGCTASRNIAARTLRPSKFSTSSSARARARLNVSVVRRDKAAVGAGALLNPFGSRNGPGVLAAYGIVNQGVSADRLDSLLSLQLDSIRANGITADELDKAKNVLRAGFIDNRETTLGKAEELHHYLTFHSSIDEINTDLDKLLAVTSDDVKRVANIYLAPGNLTLLIVRPGAAPTPGGGQ